MSEFVRVPFPNTRTVHIDGAPQGKTNTVLGVERGTHSFNLGGPADYTPREQTQRIVGTTLEHPAEIEFSQTTAPEAASTSTRRRATKKKKKAAKKKAAKSRASSDGAPRKEPDQPVLPTSALRGTTPK